ncbi:MAG TPA: HEAT repeat domain-containing protein [Bryobacteraceae bacterium]|nr:HEAT repeat domain-containing protein [Bryobacteraceae bacterium]
MKALLVLAGAAALWAQQPRLTNAKLENRAVTAGGLDREFQSLVSAAAQPAWIGWAARAVPGDHQMCCYSSFEDGAGNRCCRGCALEGMRGTQTGAAAPGPIPLEASGYILVLIRAEQRRVDRIRTFSANCELDGGGVPFFWLNGVQPGESIALLSKLALEPEENGHHRQSEGAIAAIALHADPAADRALEKFIAPNQPEAVRERTTFWLGSARGHVGYETLTRLIKEDPSDRVREKAIFGLNVSPDPDAVKTMLDIAKNDRSSRVRGQALFWLAHKAGNKEVTAITDAIENDPDTEVKKKAVFALQQLPAGEGVPLLIQVAKTNKNPAVRKQAMFWLGQSNDPRAVRFFEEVLLR